MLFLSLQCRSLSIADPDSHFPFHLYHIQEKYLNHLVQCICRNQFSFPTGMWASTCKVSRWKPAAPLLEAVDDLRSITNVLWSVRRELLSRLPAVPVQRAKSHIRVQMRDLYQRLPGLWTALCFPLSVRMVSVVQPPVSSLLLHARVAGGVCVHLWKHLGN